MATYITLVNLTDQGIRNVKESPARLKSVQALAEEFGVKLHSAYYTIGQFDMVAVMEGTDEAVTAMLLRIGSAGFVRSQTLRAFAVEEMEQIVGKLP